MTSQNDELSIVHPLTVQYKVQVHLNHFKSRYQVIITYLFYSVQRENDLSEHVYMQLTQAISYEWLGPLATQGFWPELHLNALAGYIAAEIGLKVQNVDYLRPQYYSKNSTEIIT